MCISFLMGLCIFTVSNAHIKCYRDYACLSLKRVAMSCSAELLILLITILDGVLEL